MTSPATLLHENGFTVLEAILVTGGDINEAWQVRTAEGIFFLKANNNPEAASMFAAEAEGLKALQDSFPGKVPAVKAIGTYTETSWLLLEWIERSKAATEQNMTHFGQSLARMHRLQPPFFGWQKANFIGSLPQDNTPASSWANFYADSRIFPMVRKLVDTGRWSATESRLADSFCHKLPQLMPDEPPALLHGDLWGGNYMICADGSSALFDPAVYHGHREMDIGMTRLFGGFSSAFFQGYQEVYPLVKGWEKRLSITQLYPLLVHAVLFGGHYIPASGKILQYWG